MATVDPELSPQAVAAVEEALRAFAKALRATQMYLANSPTRATSIEQARVAFSKVWRYANPLELDVREAQFVWEGSVVYQDVERGSEGLPWLLYRDGLRALSFSNGFEGADLNTLLGVLHHARTGSQDEDDLVTLLWLADLSALEYRHVESGGAVDLPTLSAETTGERAGVATWRGGGAPLAVPSAETTAPGDGPPVGVLRTEDFDSTLYFLDAREVSYLQDELKREYADDPRKQSLIILFDIVESPVTHDAQLDAVHHIDLLMLDFLSLGEYELVAYALRESATARRSSAIDATVAEALDALPARLSEPAVMSQMLQALDDSARTPVASLLEGVFTELRATALIPLVSWLGSAPPSPARAAIERASLRLAGAHTAEVARLLEHADDNVVRGALRLVAQLATPAAVPGLARILRGPDPKLRAASIAALADIGSPGALQALERGVDDTDRDVRVAALRCIVTRKHTGALPKLAQALRRKEVRDADLGEKMALFEAYGTLCGDAGVVELDTLLNARGLLGAREPAEVRACAARALGLIGTAAATAALQRAADTKDVVVRSAVARALRGGT